jgi:GT2 family glycosyltransferase
MWDADHGFPLRWWFNRRNLGYAAAANRGIALAQGAYVAIANTDILFLPGTLDALVGFLQGHADAGVVAPQYLWADRTPQPSARRLPRLRYLFSGRRAPFGLGRHAGARAREFQYTGIENSPEPVPVEALVGAFLVAPRSLLKSLHGFDERYTFYVEDMDLCRRVARAGKGVYLLPQARLVHYLGVARRRLGSAAEFLRLRSFYRYFRRAYEQVPGWCFLLLFGSYLMAVEAGRMLGLRQWEYSARFRESA